METIKYPIPSLPTTEELLLYLISEDLKSRRFFDGLRELGLDDAYYQAELCTLILIYARLSPEPNEAVDFYYHLLGKYAEHLPPNTTALLKAANKVYKELMVFKDQQATS